MKPPQSPAAVNEPCYLIGGEETSIAEKWAVAIREQVFADGGEDFNFDRFDGRQISDVEIIAQAARTLPMLSARRLVMVRNAEAILGFAKDRVKPLLDYLDQPDPSTVLVFLVRGKIPKAGALAKALRKQAKTLEFDSLKERDILPWLRGEAQDKGLRLEADAALLMVDCLANDLEAHTDALDRLSMYVGSGAPITADAVAELVAPSRTKSIWEFLDALGDRAPDRSLQAVSQLLDQGDAPLQILAMVARLYRQLTIGHTVLARGGSVNEAAQEARVPSFKARGFAQQCRRYSSQDLEHARQVIYELDGRLKSSRIDGRLWLEHGILDISAPRT